MNKVFPKVYRLPLRAGNKFGNIEPSKCRVMSSKMAPLWLCFGTVRPVGQKYQVLFKCGGTSLFLFFFFYFFLRGGSLEILHLEK